MGNGDLQAVRELVAGATVALEASRRRIDDLNVYPVPDGDTGTNLVLTARAVAEALEGLHGADRERVARAVARAALLGARGNSGVILSQVVRGCAEVLGRSHRIDAQAVARALRSGSDAAYEAVRAPVEGTMLTVVRELAEEAERQTAADPPLVDLLRSLLCRGEEALARTPEQLDLLRAAGVVDAGAAGLLETLRGLAATVTGDPLAELPAREEIGLDAVHQERSRFRYCTVFVVEGERLDRSALTGRLEGLGDSLLVVGDESALKVHVHTDDPETALATGRVNGSVGRVEVTDIHRQAEARESRLRDLLAAPRAADVVAVVAGAGNAELFRSLGAREVVERSETMPPREVILRAIEAATGAEVVVLPNDVSLVPAARQAARGARKPVRVVGTSSMQAGLAAMVAFDGDRGASENVAEMEEAAAAVATGVVATAPGAAELLGLIVEPGAYLGVAGADLVGADRDFEHVAELVVEQLLVQPRDVVTLLTGAGAPPLNGLLERLARRHPEIEFEVREGGQPHAELLLSAE